MEMVLVPLGGLSVLWNTAFTCNYCWFINCVCSSDKWWWWCISRKGNGQFDIWSIDHIGYI